MKETNLTKRQEKFCQAFIKLGDKSAAYREAYSASKMKAETVHKRASEISLKGDVSGRIKELQDKVKIIAEEKFQITAEEMLRHLDILRRSRIDSYVDYVCYAKKIGEDPDTGKPIYREVRELVFKPFDELTEEQKMCIESIKETRYGIELKLHGKEWTIEKINKHIGFYTKDNEQKQNNVTIFEIPSNGR